MIGLDKFKVKIIEEEENFSHIEIGPLPHGYGHTIGNSLRRLLLSSIPGSAVIGVKIDGVKHEYKALAGVKDDVLQIILKLKEIAVVCHSDEVQVLKIHVKGDKSGTRVVTAKDIELTGEVEIKNPEFEITTLADEKSEFKAEIYVSRGLGYAHPDENLRKEVGMIPVDAIFSPIKRVSIKILPARVGQITDLDKISLEIYSNGTVLGSQALLGASEMYDEVANRLVNQLGGDSLLAEEELKKEESEKKEEKPKILVADLGLSTRLTNSLLNAGITDLNELDGKSVDDAMDFKGMGKKSLTELVEIMSEHNLKIIE